MDPITWVSLASAVLGAMKGSTKINTAQSGAFAGLSRLNNGGWEVGEGMTGNNELKKWALLGGVVLVGVLIIKKGSK